MLVFDNDKTNALSSLFYQFCNFTIFLLSKCQYNNLVTFTQALWICCNKGRGILQMEKKFMLHFKFSLQIFSALWSQKWNVKRQQASYFHCFLFGLNKIRNVTWGIHIRSYFNFHLKEGYRDIPRRKLKLNQKMIWIFLIIAYPTVYLVLSKLL